MLAAIGFKGGMDGGVLEIFSGAIPDDADEAEGAGIKLARLTKDGVAMPGNGLTFAAPAAGSITKTLAEVWSGVGLTSGIAAWFRLYDANITTGASITALRLDGTVGTSGTDLIVTSTSIRVDVPVSITTAQFDFPYTPGA
jgi:hypothetical protein